MDNKINQNINIISNDNGLNKNNKINDNSVNKNKQITNNKIISKGKNKKKRNKNYEPEYIAPTYENGGFMCKLDEMNESLANKPLKNISFIRPQLEILYEQNIHPKMVAYVSEQRKKDKMFVLKNLCSESLFLSDHVLVKMDDENKLSTLIGKLIIFDATIYRYCDKYSVKLSNIEEIISPRLRIYQFDDLVLESKKVFKIIKKLNKDKEYLNNVLKILTSFLEIFSFQIFGSSKFIIGMVIDFYFLSSRNDELANNSYLNNLGTLKSQFVYILSNIIYRLDKGLIYDYESLKTRILELCIMNGSLPVYGHYDEARFNDFCVRANIKKDYACHHYIELITERYDLETIRNNMNEEEVYKEAVSSTATVLNHINL